MCRFLAYAGSQVTLSEMLYEPEHSLIHQSVHAHEREEPLNGDGWGVGWYDPRASDALGLYRTLHPAWSDENMRHVSPVIQTPVFLAHVRAASPGLAVQQLNCHPFRGGQHTHDPGELGPVEAGRRRLLFMHNGGVGGFSKLRRRLLDRLSDAAFESIRGSTDSEHVFALVQDALGEDAADPSCQDLAGAIEQGVAELAELRDAAGTGDERTNLNVCLSDGRSLVAMRYVDDEDVTPPSLYVGQAGGFVCSEGGALTATRPEAEEAAIVASERLWEDERVWTRVPENHLALVAPDRSVRFEPVEAAR